MENVKTRLTSALNASRRSDLGRAIAEDRAALLDGRRVRRGSQDPAAAAQSRAIDRSDARENALAANRRDLAAALAAADVEHEARVNLLTRALEIAVAATSETSSDTARSAAGIELRDIVGRLRLIEREAARVDVPISGVETGRLAPPPAVAATVETVLGQLNANDAEGLKTSLTALRGALDISSDARTRDGLLAQKLERLDAEADLARIARDDARERAVGIDPAEVIARLQARQLTLDAANALFARLDRTSLFDLLR